MVLFSGLYYLDETMFGNCDCASTCLGAGKNSSQDKLAMHVQGSLAKVERSGEFH